jgi:predicted TIM-barrel fold metal-dependent hydrolase
MAINTDSHAVLGAARSFRPPPGACDCHCHIVGSPGQYATVALAGYTAPVAPLESYLAMASALGFERRVFVQPVIYGGDSRCIFDALRRLGSEASRGIGGMPGELPGDAALAEWHDLGIRGVRLNYTPYKPYEAGFTEAILSDVEQAAALVRDVGWVLDVLAPTWLTMELLPHLERMRITYTLGHFGKFPAANGTDHPVFRELLSRFADGGCCWVKLCAAYQVSDEPDFSDVSPVARALYEAAPERVLWGTDWPHIRHEAVGDAGALLDLFGAWFPASVDRQRILVDNPARLFGFDLRS